MDKKWFKMILLFLFYIKYLFFDFFFPNEFQTK